MRTLNDIPSSLQENAVRDDDTRAFVFGMTLKSFLIRAAILIMPGICFLALLLTHETFTLSAGRILMLTFYACLPGVVLVCGAELLGSDRQPASMFTGSLFYRPSPVWFVRGTGYAFAIGLSVFCILAMFR